MAASELNTLLERVEAIASTAEEETRKNVINTLRHTAVELEAPGDSFQRIIYLALQPALCRIGDRLNLFEILSKDGGPMTTSELAEKTKCDPVLMSRILRFLASLDILTEVDEDVFQASRITTALAKPGLRAGLAHNFDTLGPVYQALPDFLETTGYKNPEDSNNTSSHMGWKTSLPIFAWLQGHPEKLGYFAAFMAAQREGMPLWLDTFPMAPKTEGFQDPEGVLFVDIGGGIGHQCAELKKKYPALPGRVILQDRAENLPHMLRTKGVETMAHDFFTPQPIKNARFYYMRNVLHDWPDAVCKTILSQIRGAMGPDSVVLIDELVLPNKGTDYQAMQLDFTMINLAAMERTRKQWDTLLDLTGFKIIDRHPYQARGDSILECVPK